MKKEVKAAVKVKAVKVKATENLLSEKVLSARYKELKKAEKTATKAEKTPAKKVAKKTAEPKVVEVKKVIAEPQPVVQLGAVVQAPAEAAPKVGKHRLPTIEEELQAFKRAIWAINLHRTITMNEKEIFKILERFDHWVGAHSDFNGERRHEEIQANVNNAFWEFIAGTAPE